MIVQLCAQFWDKFPNGTFDHEGEQCKMLRMEDLADINLHEHSKRGAHIKKNYSDLWTFVHVDAKYMNFLELTDKYNEITELDSFRLNDKHLQLVHEEYEAYQSQITTFVTRFQPARFIPRAFGNACQLIIVNGPVAEAPILLPELDYKHADMFKLCTDFQLFGHTIGLIKETREKLLTDRVISDFKYKY